MLSDARLFLKIGSCGTIVKQNCLHGPIGRLRSPEVGQQEEFRQRLKDAVERAGRKKVARPDGEVRDDDDVSVSQGGLSKILSGLRPNPGIFTIKTIADAAGVTVGQLLGEKGFELTPADRETLEEIAQWIAKKLGQGGSKTATPVTTPKQPLEEGSKEMITSANNSLPAEHQSGDEARTHDPGTDEWRNR